MIKKAGILLIAFVLAIFTIILLNDDIEKDNLLGETLYTTTTVDTLSELVIHSEYNEDSAYKLTDEQLKDIAKDRIKIVENSDLTDTIEVYTINMYDDITQESIVLIDGNTITITSDIGPTVFYTSPSFLTYLQFDYNFFETVTYRYFVIYVPEGLEYNLD